jgi:hypothetical protein
MDGNNNGRNGLTNRQGECSILHFIFTVDRRVAFITIYW